MTTVPVAEPPPRAEPGAAALDVLLPPPARSPRRAPRAARSAGSCSSTSARSFVLLAVGVLGHRPVHARDRPRASRSRTSSASSRRRSTATSRWRTIQMAVLVTIADAVLAFPIAYYMARVASPRTREPPRRRRAHAALGELPRQGLRVADDPLRGRRHQLGARAARALASTGYSTVGLWLVFTYLWLPFMILPIYAGLERIPSSLLEASADLGGRSLTTFRARDPAARVPGDRRRLDLHVLAHARRLHRAGADHERAVHRHGHLQHPRRGAADRRRVLDRPDRRRSIAYLLVARRLGAFESL